MLHSLGVKLLLGIGIDWKSFWKRFRDHKAKLFQESVFNVALTEAPEVGGKPHYTKIAGAIHSRNDWKNESLYVSWKNGFLNPVDIMDKEKARNAIILAKRSYELNKRVAEQIGKFSDRGSGDIIHMKPLIEEALKCSEEEMAGIVNKLGGRLGGS